jgi:hypothetical protein
MKLSIAILAGLLAMMLPSIVFAWSLFGPNNEQDCLLKYLQHTKCPLATFTVKQACACKFTGACGNLCSDASMADCLLENIGEAQTDQAVVFIKNTCYEKTR